ncbi:MAG: NAD-dependent epimerase/dehydratase family protein [Syntrophales bacterium]|jgi:dTDP-L-rhamnose 4-epimerase|nr:NAD-dependent epimerase/dehydratase family protein [Syntrophales bacterium]
MSTMIGKAYGIPTIALRLFNVYGSRQALSNPYTGVMAIFAARYLNDKPPLIFEDGAQMLDFLSIYDIARSFRFALEAPEAVTGVLNIGSGEARSILTNKVYGNLKDISLRKKGKKKKGGGPERPQNASMLNPR